MDAVVNSKPATALGRLIKPLISPAVFDFWAGELGGISAWERPLARVVERRVEARDTVTLRLQPSRHFAGFAPGQHVNVGVEVNGTRLTRSYSPSSIPRADGAVEITVRQVAGGRVSTQLCRETQIGDVLELGPAYGEMTLPQPATEAWLFLAAGSGITPLMSLVRALVARGPLQQDLTLVYWARQRADLCFAAELQGLAAREPRFRLQLVLTQQADLLAGESRGRPGTALLADLVPDLARHRAYACGPRGFVDSLRELVGNSARSFQAEAFTPSAPMAATGTVRVELRASGRVLELPAGQPLLAALEAQGVKPDYGCRMGICNTCACSKLGGTTQNLNSGEAQAEPEPALRLCISAARSDLILEL